MPKDSDGGGGGPITFGAKDGMEGIEGIVGIEGIEGMDGIEDMEGMGGGPIRVELIGVGGPRFKGGKVEPKETARAAELSVHMEVEPRDGPMGVTEAGKFGRREWYMLAAAVRSEGVGGGGTGADSCSSFRD